MTRFRLLLLFIVTIIIVLLATGLGAWYYLFGPNKVESAELVPSDTVFFASIPNAASLLEGYQTSQLKQLVDSPNAQPIADSITNQVGQKSIDLLKSFLPNLSGQSFIAVTHFDSDKPEQTGIVAAMKPKAGMDNFDAFVNQLKTSWPDIIKQGTTGTGNVAGVDYQWLKGPGGADMICVAKIGGWIVTTWGEAPLQDWIERYQKKSATPSLAKNPDYLKSLTRVGPDSLTLVYLNYHVVIDGLRKELAKTNPDTGDYLAKKLGAIGSIAMGTRFENGEIADHISCLIPRQAQTDAGMAVVPCPFDTLKFTGPKTRLYWGSSINIQQYWKNLQDEASQSPTLNPTATYLVNSLQAWAQVTGIDIQHNIIDALGSEFSLQAEWNDDTTYPEIGFFIKVDKPDDFKPTIDAIITTTRAAYHTSAVINELTAPSGQNFAALKFYQAMPVAPTITETGPYFGFFLSENLAVRSFSRDEAVGLPHNVHFTQQIGDKRNGASQIIFVDTPQLLNRTYQFATPYVSLLTMFNKDFAAWMQGKTLPSDISWLGPIGTWSFVLTPDNEGVNGYSVSGVGNQGILVATAGSAAITVAQSMGVLPKMPAPSPTLPITPPPTPAPVAPNPAAPAPTNSPVPPPPTADTNAAPAANPAATTPPPAAPAPTPDASTNAAPSPSPDAPKSQ